MNPLHDLVETRIREAREEGLFDDLPHKGKPVPVENDSRVPAELRGAYSVLKQAGVLPEEMELKKSIITLRSMLEAVAPRGARRARGTTQGHVAALRPPDGAPARESLSCGPGMPQSGRG